jgi:two-component system, NarL family, invasion response regulator UvrY
MLEAAGVGTVLEASDALSGYERYLRHRPEVVIVDLAMQGSAVEGLALVSRINAHDQNARILVLSMHNDPIIVTRALKAGAIGYVLEDTSSESLLEAFEKVRAGTPYLSENLAQQVALGENLSRPASLAGLAPREQQILSLLAEGKPYARIADELGVTYKTVANACAQLRKKLDARNLSDLIRIAVRLLSTTV